MTLNRFARGGGDAKAQDDFLDTVARATINVAERPPSRRGPWIFDEDDLQRRAELARLRLARKSP